MTFRFLSFLSAFLRLFVQTVCRPVFSSSLSIILSPFILFLSLSPSFLFLYSHFRSLIYYHYFLFFHSFSHSSLSPPLFSLALSLSLSLSPSLAHCVNRNSIKHCYCYFHSLLLAST